MSTPLEVFCCYAHNNLEMLTHLKNHLEPLQQEDLIRIWCDTDLNAGDEWDKELHRHLESANIFLLLISSDFMKSKYSYSIEMRRAIQRHELGEARVIPIILLPVYWQGSPFGKLQVLPRGAQPIISAKWHTPDDAFLNVVENIRKIVIIEHLLKDGRTYSEAGDHQEALLCYENALVIDPHNVFAAIGKGHALHLLGHYQKALAAFEQAIRLDPNNAFAYAGKGHALHLLGHYQKALAAFEQAIRLDPNNASASDGKKNALEMLDRQKIKNQLVMPIQKSNPPRKWIIPVFLSMLVVVLSGSVLYTLRSALDTKSPKIVPISQQQVTFNGGKQITIGISDGRFSFATPTLLGFDPFSDDPKANGETCIYENNRDIRSQYVTIVAVVSLSNTDNGYSFGLGNATLQGFCQKQSSWNANKNNKTMVRILIANIGGQAPDILQKTMPIITSQLIALSSGPNKDETFIGTVGFTFSASLDDHYPISPTSPVTYDINTMKDLKGAGIPVISTAAASSDSNFVNDWIGYFYRMNPDNEVEAQVAAAYAHSKNKKTAFIFYDSSSPYSKSLATAFISAFPEESPFFKEAPSQDMSGKENKFKGYLGSLNNNPPDMIFCACVAAGDSPDFSLFYNQLQSYSHLKDGQVMLMGADGLYNPEGDILAHQGKTPNVIAYQNMSFTALASPDTISLYCTPVAAGCSDEQKKFSETYCSTFDPQAFSKNDCKKTYGFSRPGKSTMLAYDALSTLLNAYTLVPIGSSGSLLGNVQKKLQYVSFQGITGSIRLSSASSSPVHKMVLVIEVGEEKTATVKGYCGEFTQAVKDYSLSC